MVRTRAAARAESIGLAGRGGVRRSCGSHARNAPVSGEIMRPLVRPLLVVAVGVLAARCHEAPVTAPQPITSLPRQLSVAEHGLIAADNQFAFKLFREIARQAGPDSNRSEEHTSELQSPCNLVCRLLLEK